MAKSPYNTAPNRSFWSRAVTRDFRVEDLVPPGTLLFQRGDAIMSAGSCFAANIVPYLERSGFSYVRTERRLALLQAPPENLGYDNFSAAYGNIYTARQLRQLMERALGIWRPQEDVWELGGEFIDPFRPGLRYRARSRPEFDALTHYHLECVRRAFEISTVFVFTLGLTEAWVSLADGAGFPACPGTVAGEYDAKQHAFHNMSVTDTVGDLTGFINTVRTINSEIRIVLTVSPVPLVATATGGHVLPATTYSKSVLRVAADEVVRSCRGVTYFPAYEIVTGPQAPTEFFEADKRNVSKAAVDAVMAALLANCEAGDAIATESATPSHAGRAAELSRFVIEAECEEVMSDAELHFEQAQRS